MSSAFGALVLLLLAWAVPAPAADDPPMPSPAARGTGEATAESRYNDGRELARTNDWRRAEDAYRDAIRLRAAFPEAWNGLGHALRKQARFEESVRAYQEALRLRPSYPQALEYLGEAYVQMGRLEEARAILTRLRPLDAREAEELAEAIRQASARR